MAERIAVYPGTFDPVTNGHIDVISRAARLCDRLIVGVAINIGKGPLFDLEERVALVRDEVALLDGGVRIEVRAFDSLLITFARSVGASMIVRGLRAVSDFDYEFQMAGMNRRMDPGIETVFLMAKEEFSHVSSSLLRQIAALGGDQAWIVHQFTVLGLPAVQSTLPLP